MKDSWELADVFEHFCDLLDAATEGRPQFIRNARGDEVVMISKETFERSRQKEDPHTAVSADPEGWSPGKAMRELPPEDDQPIEPGKDRQED